ncbi:MAG: NarK/NasA family nitrate transporter [Chloroflexota bacterium]|nr:MAG: NarK/NasA family nitrate transporter [Chloroflexota bacterium]
MTEKHTYRSYAALILATLAFALCFAIWGLIAPLAPQFRHALDLSTTEAGLLVAVPVILGSLARIPMGMLTDRYGGVRVFTSLMVFLLLPLGLSFLATSYAGLLFLGFWLGLAGSSFAIGIPYVSRWFPPHQQGLALGIYGMGNIGTALAATVAPRVAEEAPWYQAFWIFIVPLVALVVLFWLIAPREVLDPARRSNLAGLLEILRDEPLAWLLSLFYFVTFGGFVATSIFLPTLLVDLYDVERESAGEVAAVFVVMATLARPIGGWLSDRQGGAVVLLGVLAAVVALAAALATQLSFLGALVIFVALGISLGLGNGAVFKLVPQFFPARTGTVTGLVGAAGGLGGFFPPIVLGFVRDATDSYAIAFLLLSLFAGVCLLLDYLILLRGRVAAHEG